jgi:hypothetical protein
MEITAFSFCCWGLPDIFRLRWARRVRIICRQCDFRQVFAMPKFAANMTAAFNARDIHELENFHNVFIQQRIGTYWVTLTEYGDPDRPMKLPDPEDFGLTALELSR